MKKISFVLFLLAFTGISNAQQFHSDLKKPGTEKPGLPELQASFQDFVKANDLDETKGWKWYRRWEQFHGQRANPDGSIADDRIFMNEAIKVAAMKKKMAATKDANSSWLPYGPNALPTSPNSVSGHGMARINCIEFHPTDPNTFWVGVAQGGVWKTTNSGQSWTPLTDELPILRISDIEVNPQDPDEMYIAVGDFEYIGVSLALDDRKRHSHFGLGVYKTMDGGVTWNPTGLAFNQTQFDNSLIRKIVLHPTDDQQVVAAGVDGIFRSTDAGASWTTVLDSLVWDMEMDTVNIGTIYAATGYVGTLQEGNAGIYKSIDFGLTWTLLNTGIPAQGLVQRVNIEIAPSNPDILYAVSCDMVDGFYAMYRSIDGGATWTVQSDFNDGVNILEWYGGSGSGGQGTYDLAMVIDPVNSDRVFVGGVNMWGSDDGGATWDGCSYWVNYYGTSIHADQHQYRFNGVDGKWYVCNDGGVMRTDDLQIGSWDDANNIGGYEWPTTWENLSDGMQITSFYRLGLSANNPGFVIAGAQDNSTFYYDNNSWINIIGGDGMECLLDPNDPSFLYGSWQYGGLANSWDGGQSLNYYLADYILNTVGEESEWVSPFMLNPANSSELYFGAGNLWKTYDEGNNWSQMSSFPNMSGAGYPSPASALAMSTNFPDHIYIAKRIYHSYGEMASLYTTPDDGGTWNNITAGLPDSLYFTYVAVDNNDPNIAWVTCSGFVDGVKVFKTSDAGQNWTNISMNLPNIPVNCIVLNEASEDHTLYIGTDLGVFYTNDVMSDWQVYGVNLPNVIVSELEIQYQENKMYAATFGRGIWTIESTVGIEGQEAVASFAASLYPSPNNGAFQLDLEAEKSSTYQLKVIDIMGREVHTETFETGPGMHQRSVNLEVASGQYFLHVSDGSGSRVVKFVVAD
jgi:photosystem II stability/assembly factor-like uncharacterized protein